MHIFFLHGPYVPLLFPSSCQAAGVTPLKPLGSYRASTALLWVPVPKTALKWTDWLWSMLLPRHRTCS